MTLAISPTPITVAIPIQVLVPKIVPSFADLELGHLLFEHVVVAIGVTEFLAGSVGPIIRIKPDVYGSKP
jgi:hypothetical protein